MHHSRRRELEEVKVEEEVESVVKVEEEVERVVKVEG